MRDAYAEPSADIQSLSLAWDLPRLSGLHLKPVQAWHRVVLETLRYGSTRFMGILILDVFPIAAGWGDWVRLVWRVDMGCQDRLVLVDDFDEAADVDTVTLMEN